jgi:hypothetical protein
MKHKRGFVVVHTTEATLEEHQKALMQTFEERIGTAVEAVLRQRGEVPNPEPGSAEWFDREVAWRLIYIRDAIDQGTNPEETRRLNDVAFAGYEMGWAAVVSHVKRWYKAKGRKGGKSKESDDPLAELALHQAAGLGTPAAIKAMAANAGINRESMERAVRRARAKARKK